MIRYAITHINRDGMRQITGANQGRYFKKTMRAAQKEARDIMKNNTPEKLASIFGKQSVGTFEARAVECYETGDAKGIYFDA